MIMDLLKNHPQHINTIVHWLYNEFGSEASKKFYKDIVNHSLIEGHLPITFIAIENNEVIGTVGIWRGDLLSRQDLSPWFSALYVRKDCRSKGIGVQLQKYALNYCKSQGYKEIYLYTDIENYYERTGWEFMSNGYEYSGDKINIYKFNL